MSLLDSAVTTGTTAPYWIVEALKTLGFALHMIPMGVLLIGIPISILFWLLGGTNGKRLAQRLFQQAPVFVVFTACLGCAPLLFLQLTYSKLFYTTTIVFAAHWLGILSLLLTAYVVALLCARAASKERIWSTLFLACGTTACFLCMGLIFTSVLTVFERPYLLESSANAVSIVFLKHSFVLGGSGTVNGLGYYWRDLSIYIRFACLMGVACHAFAFWIVYDAFKLYTGPRKLTDEEEMRVLEAQEEEADEENGKKKRRRGRTPLQENADKYREFVLSAACVLVVIGCAIAIPALLIYVKRLSDVVAAVPNYTLWNVLYWGIYAFLAAPLVFLILGKLQKLSGGTVAFCLAVCELCLVGTYSLWRQTIQNVQLSPYFDPATQTSVFCFSENAPEELTQWSPFFMFLGVLVVVGVWSFWILRLATPKTQRPKKAKKEKAPKKEKPVKEKKMKKSKKAEEDSEDSKEDKQGGLASQLTLGSSVNSSSNPKKPNKTR